MLRSLDHLLGQSTFDPGIRSAYEAGQVAQLLDEFNFPQGVQRQLCALEADSFDAFANKAYAWILAHETPDGAGPDPWPTQGLPESMRLAKGRDQAA